MEGRGWERGGVAIQLAKGARGDEWSPWIALRYHHSQMPKRTLRFLEYSIHAHVETGNPDYLHFIRQLVDLKGKYRKSGRRVMAVGAALLAAASGGTERLFLIIYSGDDDQSVLFFDVNQQSEFSSSTGPGRFVARKTHVLIDPVRRTVVIEAGRGHPSAEELAQFIEDEAQQLDGYGTLELSFAPKPTRAFAEKIIDMQRIQSATVSLARPNADWADRYSQLTGFAADSNAKVIDATVRAGRRESLSKQSGLVPSLVHWLTETLPSVVNAKIKGATDADSPLVELRLSDYVETATLSIDVNAETKMLSDSAVRDGMSAYLDSQERENG